MNEPRPLFDLGPAAERFRIREGDVDEIVAVARRRTRRKHRVVSVATAVALVASIPVAQRLLAPSDDGTPVAATGAVDRASLGIRWQRADTKATIGPARSLATEGPLYAVSSAPGERAVEGRQLSRVVWQSDDGVEWAAVSTLGDDLYLADLSPRDSRVYAVGTAPAEGAQPLAPGRPPTLRSSDLVVGWSDDGARRWQKKKLPLDLPADVATRHGSVVEAKVASGPRGTVVVALLSAELEVPALLPSGASAPNGWATTASGVDVLGPDKAEPCPPGFEGGDKERNRSGAPGEVMPTWCQKGEEVVTVMPQEARGVVASYTWEQLGVRGDLLDAVRRQPFAYFAEPGRTDFTRVELPEASYLGGVTAEATEDGFAVMASTGDWSRRGMGELVLLRSSDGRSWTKSAVPGDARWSAGLGTLGGRTAFVTAGEKGGTFVVDNGDDGRTSVPLADIVEPGALEGRMVTVNTAAFGPFGVAIAVVLVPPDKEYNEDAISHRLLVSRDGTTWEDIAFRDVVGDPRAYVNRLTITGDEIVVTTSIARRAPAEGPQQQMVMVGRVG